MTRTMTEWAVGQLVEVQPRTWAGINRPGGHGKITAVHFVKSSSSGGTATAVVESLDVKYTISGGFDKDLNPALVKPYIELERRGRRRKQESSTPKEEVPPKQSNEKVAETTTTTKKSKTKVSIAKKHSKEINEGKGEKENNGVTSSKIKTVEDNQKMTEDIGVLQTKTTKPKKVSQTGRKPPAAVPQCVPDKKKKAVQQGQQQSSPERVPGKIRFRPNSSSLDDFSPLTTASITGLLQEQNDCGFDRKDDMVIEYNGSEDVLSLQKPKRSSTNRKHELQDKDKLKDSKRRVATVLQKQQKNQNFRNAKVENRSITMQDVMDSRRQQAHEFVEEIVGGLSNGKGQADKGDEMDCEQKQPEDPRQQIFMGSINTLLENHMSCLDDDSDLLNKINQMAAAQQQDKDNADGGAAVVFDSHEMSRYLDYMCSQDKIMRSDGMILGI